MFFSHYLELILFNCSKSVFFLCFKSSTLTAHCISFWCIHKKLKNIINFVCTLWIHWQTKHSLLGLMPGRPVDNRSQDGDYSACVAWEKENVETRKTSQGAQLSVSSRLPWQSLPLLWSIIYPVCWPEAHLIPSEEWFKGFWGRPINNLAREWVTMFLVDEPS